MASQDELEARRVAEDSREKKWKGESFIKDLFLGNYRLDLIHPYPTYTERPEFKKFYDALATFLKEKVDPVEIDRTGQYPPHVVKGLADLGAFGMKIPKEYGGLGLTHPEYVRTLELVGAHDGNVTALLSAHQAIGVPQPVKLFGTEAQKKEFLPRCAKGAISAFALTEPAVGSDPGRLETTCRLSDDGEHWILDGQKLWCTNGTLAELLVVMARNEKSGKINCFVVETAWEGVIIDHRCHFMGLKALANAVVSFKNVKVPKDNLIGAEGSGLKIALITLNTGRLSLPAATAGGSKMALELCRKWCNARVQWGVPIGMHEAVAHKLADLAATSFAMESVAHLVGDLADRKGTDIRLEAAAAKEWNTVQMWTNIDEALQIRGGRGYETEASLKARGEPPAGIERGMRDARINLIFEGSSEIMHLFMAREAVDKHLAVAGALADPKASLGAKLAALPKIALYYAWWFPTRFLSFGLWPRYSSFGRLGKHLRFAHRAGARLARQVFYGMARFGPKLEKRQAFLFHAVDVAMELFVLTATVAAAARSRASGEKDAEHVEDLADLLGRSAKIRVNRWLDDMSILQTFWADYDAIKTNVGKAVLAGDHVWLERGTLGVPYDSEDLRPPTVKEILEKRTSGAPKKALPDNAAPRAAGPSPSAAEDSAAE